jgi:AraC family transcriptional regulator
MKFSEATGANDARTRASKQLKVRQDFYPPGLRQPRHSHLYASFSFVSSGTYLESFGKRTFTRQASTVVFHPPYESHSVEFESRVQIVSVHFGFEKLARVREHTPILDSPSDCRTETVCWLGARLGEELRRGDAASGSAVEGLVLELLAEASRCKTGDREKHFPQWLKEARDYLHDNFAESFSLETVARAAGVHPVHLARVFREKFGCTAGEYVRRLRVEFVCRQITTTEMPLGEIAAAAGFSDQSHLNRIFKHRFNLTPYEYRKNSRPR